MSVGRIVVCGWTPLFVLGALFDFMMSMLFVVVKV